MTINDDEETNNSNNNGSLQDLLLRHSSPLSSSSAVVTAMVHGERNSSPSPLRMTRPRSNPRNRTPMRYHTPEQQARAANAVILEAEDEGGAELREARRISIRPLAGRPVGTTAARGGTATTRVTDHNIVETGGTRSSKQGPSHRKVRRWNNDNFVNLATELKSTGNVSAARALLRGHVDASQHPVMMTFPDSSLQSGRPRVMQQFLQEDEYRTVREQFFQGIVLGRDSTSSIPTQPSRTQTTWTPEQLLHRMDARLRRVVVKACENSMPASRVVSTLESYLLNVILLQDTQQRSPLRHGWWKDLLLQAPTVTRRQCDGAWMIRFVFGADSSAKASPSASTGGFHRLLLHGLCQFHGLQAMSTTETKKKANTSNGKDIQQTRVLTAMGKTFLGETIKLVDYIMQRNQQPMQHDVPVATSSTTALEASVETLRV